MIADMFSIANGDNAELLEALAVFKARFGTRPAAITARPGTPIPDQIAPEIPRVSDRHAAAKCWYFVIAGS